MSQDKAANQSQTEPPVDDKKPIGADEVEAQLVQDLSDDEAVLANGDEPVPADAVADADDPQALIEDLKAKLESATTRADEQKDLALRTHAEMDNLRKRQSRELENAHKYALDKIAEELLPVRDTLELGVAAADEEQAELAKIVEGTELTLKMLTQALEKFNICEVNPVGEKFNPDLHQAISVQEGTDKDANIVLNVMQKGYTLNDRLLRPAMVVIAK